MNRMTEKNMEQTTNEDAEHATRDDCNAADRLIHEQATAIQRLMAERDAASARAQELEVEGLERTQQYSAMQAHALRETNKLFEANARIAELERQIEQAKVQAAAADSLSDLCGRLQKQIEGMLTKEQAVAAFDRAAFHLNRRERFVMFLEEIGGQSDRLR